MLRKAVDEDRKLGAEYEPDDSHSKLIKLLSCQTRFQEALTESENFRDRPLSQNDRVWNNFQLTALSEIAGQKTKPKLGNLDPQLSKSEDPDIVMYLARTTALSKGDTPGMIKQIDAIISKRNKDAPLPEGLLLAKASLAMTHRDADTVTATLNRLKPSKTNDSKQYLKQLFEAWAKHSKTPTGDLRNKITECRKFLEGVKTNQNPAMGGYATSNQLELRVWCDRLEKELPAEKK